MKMLLFARRNGQEILRDPLNLAFGLVFPLALLGLFCAIQANIPVPIFALPRDFSLWFQLFLPVFRPSGGPGPDQRLFPAAIYNASAATGLHPRLHPPPGAPGPGTRSRMSGRRFGLWTGMEPPASPDVGGQPACSPIVHQPGTALRLLPQRPGCGWDLWRAPHQCLRVPVRRMAGLGPGRRRLCPVCQAATLLPWGRCRAGGPGRGPGAAASSPGLGLRLGPCNPGFGNCRLLPFFAAHLNIKRLQQGE